MSDTEVESSENEKATNHGLRSNSMTWVGAAVLGAIIMSPASGLYFNFTPMEAAAGKVVPFVFIVAMVVTLPTALSYASLSRSLPSAGASYTWMRRATNPGTGIFAGWILNGFYLMAQVVLPGIGALFFNDLLSQAGLHTGYWTWAVGVLLMTGIVVAFNYRGISLSLRSTVVFMITESIVVFALMLTIFIVQGRNGQFTGADALHSFNPSFALGGSGAIFGALVFGIQSNVGFDAVSTLAEETKTPRKFIPIATVVAVITVGIYWIITGLGFVAALPLAKVLKVAASGGTPVAAIANRYWGSSGQALISVIAFSSIAAIFLAQNVASSRTLYAMGRQGAAPRVFGRVGAKDRVPNNAMTLGLIVTVLITLFLGALLGTVNQYNWTGTMSSLLALLTYLSVNIANFVYHWRFKRSEFQVWMHGVVPALGVVVVCFVIEKSYLLSLWKAGWTYGRSVQLAVVIWLALGACWVFYLRKTQPNVFDPELDVVFDFDRLNETSESDVDQILSRPTSEG